MQARFVLASCCLSAVALTSACAEEDALDLDPEVQAVLDAAVDDADGVAVYRYEGTLQPGDVVEPVAVGEGDTPFAMEVRAPSAFYFVDEQPEALFGHPASFAMVDTETGEVTVQEAEVWPMINGEPFAPFGLDPVFGEAPAVEAPVGLELVEQQTEFREGDAPCERKNYAITIDGAGTNTVLAETVMQSTLVSRGWNVIRVPHQGDAAKTKAAALAAIAELAALPDDTIGEVMIYYVGHGLEGLWLFGSKLDFDALTYHELAEKIRLIKADDVTMVVDSCHSGWIANRAELILQDGTKWDERRVRVLTATTEDGIAVVKPREALAGALFTNALTEEMASMPRDEEWDFDDPSLFAVPPLHTTYKQKPHTQTAQSVVVKPDRPRLLPYEFEGRCDVVGNLEVQDYAREVRFEGKWLGDEDGHIELQDIHGEWQTLETIYWGKNNVIAPIPMRRDGFPSTGKSMFAPEGTPPGYYLARVVKADGTKSLFLDEYLVKVELQVYEVSWKPNYDEYDYPAWQEMWQPFTKGDFTAGPTIQESYVHILSDHVTDLTKLDSDTDVEHWESEYLKWDTLGDWSYDLPPAERNLATAYDQRYPDFNYYGFRAAFAENYLDSQTWVYLLAYD